MKVVSLILGLFLSTSVFAGSLSKEAAVSKGGSILAGLWQGVDFEDGGNSYRQILSVNAACKVPPCDNVFELRGRDTWHGPCGYGDPAPITGELVQSSSHSLDGTWSLDCQAPPTDVSGDRDLLVEYTYDPKEKTLTETLISPATGLPIDRTPIVFYKVNTR